MWNIRSSRLGLFLSIALVAAFTVVPVAVAQDSSDPSSAQYDPPIPESAVAGSSASGGSGGDPSGLNSNIGSLPFTGMDLLIVAGVAFVLAGTGFALRRLSTPPSA
jgi:hypothetical protein